MAIREARAASSEEGSTAGGGERREKGGRGMKGARSGVGALGNGRVSLQNRTRAVLFM
jgi:hypothetical protein